MYGLYIKNKCRPLTLDLARYGGGGGPASLTGWYGQMGLEKLPISNPPQKFALVQQRYKLGSPKGTAQENGGFPDGIPVSSPLCSPPSFLFLFLNGIALKKAPAVTHILSKKL